MTLESGKPMEEIAIRQQKRRTSLRARIALATTLTAIAAALVVGYSAFLRSEVTQSFLGDQFQESTKEKAENQIQALVTLEAQTLNKFFDDIDQSTIATAAYTANLLNQSITFEAGNYWDAEQKLYRLPSGAWDNPNTDPSSVFAPADFELTEAMRSDLNAVIHLDLIAPEMLQDYPNTTAVYYISANDITVYYPNIDLANVVPPDFKATEQPFFTIAASINNKNTAWTPPYQGPALTGLIVTDSSPVYDNSGRFRGVVGYDVQLARFTSRVLDIQIGETGFAFLIDSASRIIAMPVSGYEGFNLTPEVIPVNETPQLRLMEQAPPDLRIYLQGMAQGGRSLNRVQIHGVEHYLAYAPISSPKYSLGILVPVSEMDAAVREAQALVAQENRQTQNFGLFLLAIVFFAALLISFGLGQVLTNPLNRLTATADQISAGDLTAKAPETSVSEVNVLAEAFNAMTSQLNATLTSLEERVAERTYELETATHKSQRRASQFEAIAQVARSISRSQNLEMLLPKITNVISQQFGFYHVGIFLMDTAREYAVLRASNSPGGQKMLAREHKLKVGEVGIVGYVTSKGNARIALDTGTDAVYFDNPDLPDTRSEMALPIFVGNQLTGALDVQSLEPNAFSQEDVDTLSTLADQVGIAIQNAHLYEETQNALAQSQVLLRQFTQTGWSQFTRTQKLTGIQRSKASTTLLEGHLSANELNGDGILGLPINLHGQKIGSLKVRATDDHQWTQDEIDIASAIIERAAIAMENARLLEEAQRRATRERVIGDISASINTFSDMEGILRTAVQQLGSRLGGAEVVLELGTKENES